MQRFGGVIQDTLGNALANSTVTVFSGGSTGLAVLYSDNVRTGLGNPFISGVDGTYEFYAQDGRYDITPTKAGYSISTVPVRDQILYDGPSLGVRNVKDFGARGDGVTNDASAFQAAVTAALNTTLRVPFSSYKLDSNVIFPSVKNWVVVEPGVTYSGTGRLVLDSLIPNQTTPVLSSDLISNSYTDSTAGNIFQRASHLAQTGTAPGVAVFGQGVGSGAGSSVWGGNFVGYANHATATGRGVEINYGALVAGGTAYGLIIAAAGNNPVNRSISIQTNTAAAQTSQGIWFAKNGTFQPVTAAGTLIGTDSAMTAGTGIDFTGTTFSVSAIAIPNDSSINALNQAGSALRRLIKISAADDVVLGDAAANLLIAVSPFLIQGDLARPFRIGRSTTAVTAPGADIGLLRWENGTNAGTLKLVGYSGTSTTGVTVVDNVGAGN